MEKKDMEIEKINSLFIYLEELVEEFDDKFLFIEEKIKMLEEKILLR